MMEKKRGPWKRLVVRPDRKKALETTRERGRSRAQKPRKCGGRGK